MSLALEVYRRLPASMQGIAATLRGYQLRRWRYGPETDRLVAEARERERWSESEWSDWYATQLPMLLDRAATRVPWYREHWAERRRRGDRASWSYLENWPILEKDVLRATPERFLADDCDPRRMFVERTSGTTGKSTTLWWSRATVREWYALFEARCRNWYGVSRHDHWAIIGGQLVTPVSRQRPPFWVWNSALNQLYMSAWHLSARNIPAYLGALERHRIRYLFAYSSAIYTLAEAIREQGLRPPRLDVLVTNAEPVHAHQREVIEAAFNAPLRETYGMSEIVTTATECEAGRLHIWPEVGVVELIEEGHAVMDGEVGDLVCTGLVNQDMPLIRYRVGDRAVRRPAGVPCSCGRTMPEFSSIEGRSDDLVLTRDGRRIGQLQAVFQTVGTVSEAQIIQESLDEFRILVTPRPGFDDSARALIIARFRDRVGDVAVSVEPVELIPRTANGKLRYVVSRLTPEQRALAGS
ncbi:MAG: Coenzyme synthetase [Gemmatimonadetes bacterium]|nr:Coenzyme synthetase [Gemmatimonadota bacterium]